MMEKIKICNVQSQILILQEGFASSPRKATSFYLQDAFVISMFL